MDHTLGQLSQLDAAARRIDASAGLLRLHIAALATLAGTPGAKEAAAGLRELADHLKEAAQ